MKEKLIEWIMDSIGEMPYIRAEAIANHLLFKGVIVPPCNPGDDIYWIDDESNTVECEKNGIAAVAYYGRGEFKIISKDENPPEALNTKWCMLTKEEAEAALAERNRT